MRPLHLCSLVSLASAAAASQEKPRLWCWLGGGKNWEQAVAQVTANKDIITDVSFGAYTLSDSGALVESKSGLNTTAVALFNSMGVRAHPEIFVGSGPTGSIDVMRTLFNDPEPFIAAAVKAAVTNNFGGFNVDLEPYSDSYPWHPTATAADGLAYAKLIDALAKALHAHGKVVSVDYFSNNPFWNLAALNATDADTLISMDTYAQQNTTFEFALQVGLGSVAPRKLGVGMKSVNMSAASPHTPYGPHPYIPQPWTASMLAERFAYLKALTATVPLAQLNLFVVPEDTERWWPALRAFYGA